MKKLKRISGSFKYTYFMGEPNMKDINMPMHYLYEDEFYGTEKPVPGIGDANPETYHNYIGAKVDIYIGVKVMSVRVRK